MKKIPFYFVMLPAIFMITSCLKQDGQNFQTFVIEPVVVVEESPLPIVSSLYPGLERFLVPDLTGRVEREDCLLLSFKIDFEAQPDSRYYTATETFRVALPASLPAVSADTFVVEGFDTPIIEAAVHRSNSGNKALIDDKLFLILVQEKNKNYEYTMVYQPFPQDLPSSYATPPNLYVSAKYINDTPSNTIDDDTYLRVFDLSDFKKYLSDDLDWTGTKTVKILCRGE
ncbi:MAG: hypothetical protein LBC40_00760, partial [Dysgonamonadaceae bacterium]|nr:hypothetical protein [Dysgonamonadaceae bacterium]